MSENSIPSTLSAALSSAFVAQFPLEALDVLEAAPLNEVVEIVASQPTAKAALFLSHMASPLAAEVIVRLDRDKIRRVLNALDPAQSALLLSNLDEKAREAQLQLLDDGLAQELRALMAFPPGTAGRLMEPRLTTFSARLTVRQALSRLRHMPTHDTATLVVIDNDGRLAGLLDLVDLVSARRSQVLAELLHGEAPALNALTPRDDVIELFTRYRLHMVPVVDIDNRVLGVIREGMIVAAAQQEASADLQAMVGVSRDERALSSPVSAVRMRLPWLNINLLTAFLASAVVGAFEDTIARFTALAVLLPVVAGQSGNTGAQALVVVMRGLALREIRLRHWRRVLGKELLAGLLNGVAIAVVTALGVLVWSRSIGLAIVIGIAMVLSMMLAGLAGAATPMVLTRLGQDPAQSASIILTTVTDVTGFMSFLGLATLFSSWL